MRIPLPGLLRELRADISAAGLGPRGWRAGVGLAMRIFRSPRLYRIGSRLAHAALRFLADRPSLLRRLPVLGGWAEGRTLPKPQATTFLQQYQRKSR